MTLGPDGLVRDADGKVIPPGRRPEENPDLQPHFDRKQRTAFARMAQACGIDPTPYGREIGIDPKKYDDQDASSWTLMWTQIGLRLKRESLLRLWNEISRYIAEGGVAHPDQSIEGDWYGVFVTGICQNKEEHHRLYGQYADHADTAVVRTGHRVDQKQAEKITAYLKAQTNVNTCGRCGEKIGIWSTDVTRINTFRARPENRNPVMAEPIRGRVKT